MKNKKGFTLIELIAVVALIAVTGLVVVISVSSMLKSQKDKDYKLYVDTILNSAELYVEQHRISYPELNEVNDSIYITVSDIIGANLLNADLKNPKTDEVISGDTRIKVTIGENNILIYEMEE